jgi:membrane protease YdiL (CAAX protease family)
MQLSTFIGLPLLDKFNLIDPSLKGDDKIGYAVGLWTTLSFTIATLLTVLVLRRDLFSSSREVRKGSLVNSLMWAFNGVFIALIGQSVAALIEKNLFGIEPGSENTAQIIDIAKVFPAFIFIIAILAPVLEEIIFRRIIYKPLADKYNFWIGATISSLFFAVVHFDFEHILLYMSMGFTFAFLYRVTNNLLVPIIAHMSMNSLVVLVQVVYADELQKLIEQNQTALFILKLLN